MARFFFWLGVFSIATGAASVAGFVWVFALLCVVGWLLFGPGGKWL